jgi:hypothetical protein
MILVNKYGVQGKFIMFIMTGFIFGRNKMTLDEFIEKEKDDSNLFWKLNCGEHQNLLDEAIERMGGAGAKSAVDDRIKCPFCKTEMQEIDVDEYKCLSLTCALAEQQSILDFTFQKSEIPKGI